ncbi:transporter [Terribacillus saccharophilus]|jgi:malonate transporter and related proteins|uniref:Transporter n=1 Tax=Terribacillus saccharophilus TaxID=361277 RepID=A0A268HDX9_9BACI|nr:MULTISPECIES: AEC family transporter [Terribacillus]PAD34457.1 transporter [Terribacillus saccharophilus]PAD95331.1 transporter [Terribacillus saccharophilus]PAD98784.1 transporter [Terribacillus saccharophilus]PAE08081.1 transporter [Terribacillus saccharophilus]VVM34919.1 Malate permease [Terribacillus sp. AE2B 122]
MSFGEIFIILVPIFFVILLGFIAGNRGIFNKETSKGINTLVTKIALPAHLFVGITTTSRETIFDKASFLVALLIGVIGFFIVLLLITKWTTKYDFVTSTMFSLNSTQPTFAFMGIPVMGSIFGADAIAIPIALMGIIVNAVLDPMSTIFGTIGTRNKDAESAENKESLFKVTMKSIAHGLTEPLACVPIIGLILVLVFNFHLPELGEKSLDQIGDVVSGVALFAVGVTIGINKIKLSLSAFSIAILKAVVQPLVMVGIALALGLTHNDFVQAVLLVSFPGSAVATMIAIRFKTLETEVASAFVISAILSIVTLPFLITAIM